MTGRLSFVVVDSAGTAELIEIPDAIAESLDIMLADRVPGDQAASLAWAAYRDGGDPVAFARHFVKLRSAFNRD